MAHKVLQQDVYGILREQIIRWERPPREALVEEGLAREFDVSRTPLRETLRRLGEEGLVTIEPHKGARVSKLTPEIVRDTFLVREALEGIAAREAAVRVDVAVLRKYRAHYEGLRIAIAEGDYRDVGDDIHEVIFAAGAGERLRKMRAVIMGQVRWIQHLAEESSERMQRSFREHDSIVLALEAKDPVAAENSARAHVRRALADVLDCLDATGMAKAS